MLSRKGGQVLFIAVDQKVESIVISWDTISDKHKSMILFSNRFDLGFFELLCFICSSSLGFTQPKNN